MILWKRHQIAFTMDTAQQPIVAGVQIVSWRSFADANRQQVSLTRFDGGSEIDIERGKTAFVITDTLAVNPDLGAVCDAIKMPEHALAGK